MELGYARVSTTKQDLDWQVDALTGVGIESALGGWLACPSCGHQPASRAEACQHRAEMAILWLHLDGGRIAEARHCAICQPHEHVIDVSCADCGDGPLVTGQPPVLGDHLSDVALDWLRGHRWQTQPQLLCPAHAT